VEGGGWRVDGRGKRKRELNLKIDDQEALPFLLCIPREVYIEESDYFDTFEFGNITYDENGDAQISRIFPEGSPAYVTANGWLCGNISKPGIYVGIKVRG
jgi:hypothetical protein